MVDETLPRRLAFAVPDWPPEIAANGITTYVAGVRAGLASLGHATYVITPRDRSGVEASDVVLTRPDWSRPARLGLKLLWDVVPTLASSVDLGVGYVRTLKRLSSVDVFEIEESRGVAAVVRSGFTGALIVRLHGPWSMVGPALGEANGLDFRARVEAEHVGIRLADAVTAPSRAVLRAVEEPLGRSLPHSAVIPNPAPPVAEDARWTEQTRVRDRVLFVGRFDRVKGPDVLLAAMEHVLARRPSVELLFVGPDRGLEVGGARLSMDQFMRERVSPAVRACVQVRGALSSVEIAQLRKTAHVTVVSSRFESFSMTSLEAVAHGCPLVASNVGGIPEIVRDGYNGLLFASEDPEQLAAQVLRILDDDGLARTLSANATHDTDERFSARSVAQRSLDVYAAARERRRHR